MGLPRIWETWLPPDISQGVLNEEPRRFSALSACVRAEVEGCLRDTEDPNRWQRLIKWLCHINTFSQLRGEYDAADLVPLAEALWAAVAEAGQDLEAQVRIADCATKLLRAHKRTLRRARLTLPWRPLFDTMRRLHGTPQPRLEGIGLSHARGHALLKLVSKGRRHFAPAALGEVWALLGPAVRGVGHQAGPAYEALGYLQLFAPTAGICACNWAAVNRWVGEWMDAWGCAANSPAWDALWMSLLSRAAKHDWRGVIRWQPHLPGVFGSITCLFDVPVGSSRGATELVGRSAPGRAAGLFGEQMGFGPFHAARLIVHLMRSTAQPPPLPQPQDQTLAPGPTAAAATAATAASPSASAASAAASQLEHLTALLEQYYHPSNTGKWCRELATLLKHLVKAAVKQLERQQPPPPSPASASAAATAAPPTDSGGAAGGDDPYDEYMADAEAGEGAGGDGGAEGLAASAAAPGGGSRPWVSELREPELQRLAACCVTLAARGQFSKDSGLAAVSISALTQLAPLAPGRVLPLVLERFRTALASATATHALAAATHTLAGVARPLLLAGWAEAVSDDGGDERETAAQLVSEALVAALPGLDANDEHKTSATLQLFTAVLGSLPRLRGAGEEPEDYAAAAIEEEEEHTFLRASSAGASGSAATGTAAATAASEAASGGLCLSLYVSDWAEEVLERGLALLTNLDSGPATRGTDLAAGGGGSGRGGHAGSSSAFLTGPRSLFGPLWHLLFHSSRPAVRRGLVRQLAGWVLGGSALGMAAEAGLVVGCAAAAAPREALVSLVLPLLGRVEAEVAELPRLGEGAGPVPSPPSAGTVALLRFQISLLAEAVGQLHADLLTAPHVHAAGGGGGASSGGASGLLPTAGSGADAGSPAVPPGSLLSRLLALCDALACVNSGVLQSEGGSLAGIAWMMLTRHWTEPHLPWRLLQPGAAVPLVPERGVEAWVDKYGTGYSAPSWTAPAPAHLELAAALVRTRLLAPAARLRGMAAGAGGGDTAAKLRMRGELHRVRGMLSHGLSMLRDFDFGFAANFSGTSGGGRGGTPLAPFGGLGAVVGEAGTREAVAEALQEVISALRTAAGADPELLDIAVRTAGLLLAAGSVEYVSAEAEERGQRALAHALGEPPSAARLLPAGTPWRRRTPMWLVQNRLFNTLLHRASAAAFRSWASTTQPEVVNVEQFPPSYISLLRLMCRVAQHPAASLQRSASSAIDATTKRFPCLGPLLLPYFLAALADVAYTDADAAEAMEAASAAGPPPALAARLHDAAFGAGSELPGDSAESESERDGRVGGSAHALSANLTFWRLLGRQPAWLAAALAALLGGRAHNASNPQKVLGDLLLVLAGRILHPPVWAAAAPVPYGAESYSSLVAALVAAGRPGGLAARGGGGAATFRYSVIANALLLLMLPHQYGGVHASGAGAEAAQAAMEVDQAGGGEGAEAAMQGSAVDTAAGMLRHFLGLLLWAESPQLRLLGMSGVFLPLCAVLEHRHPMPQLAAALRDALANAAATGGGAVEGGGDWGGRLLHALVHDHPELDNAEALKDKRGAGLLALQQKLLGMTFEEMVTSLTGVGLERLTAWPEESHPPAAVSEGAFVVRHARLVQAMAAAAPAQLMAGLRPGLEALTTPERLSSATSSSDKAEIGAAAEALAGLIASGAPWAVAQTPTAAAESTLEPYPSAGGGGTGGGWAVAALARAMRVSSLELAGTWATAYRFAVRGLLDAVLPERLTRIAASTTGAAPLRPLLAPGLAAASPAALEAALTDLLGRTVTLLPTERVTDVTASAAGSSLGDGSLPGRMKRWRCVAAAVAELAGLNVTTRELPLPVRLYWSGLLDELSYALSPAAAADMLALRDYLCGPLVNTIGYWDGAEGLLMAGNNRHARGSGNRSGGGTGGNGGNGNSNGEGDLVHVSGQPSGMSTPAEIELGADIDAPVLLLSRSADHHASPAALRSRAKELARALAEGFNAAATEVQQLRGGTGESAPAGLGGTATPRGASASSAAGVGESPSSRATAGTEDMVLVDPLDDVMSVSAATGSGAPSPGGGAASVGMDTDLPVTVAAATAASAAPTLPGSLGRLGVGAEALVFAASRHRSPGLRELAVAMLPGLMRMQELAGPELQKFQRELRVAFTLLRCLSLNTHGGAALGSRLLGCALAAVASAAEVEVPWSARAAALSYAQTLWFRHAPLLSSAQLEGMQAVITRRLPDPKPEVRSLAAATLSGLLRGAGPAEGERLRGGMLAQAEELFGGAKRRRRAGGGDPSPGTQAPVPPDASTLPLQLRMLGCVAGLSALLQSCPYDTPAWLPPVLMALVRAAGSAGGGGGRDAAVRSAAGAALGEFRRTHEAGSLEELRRTMQPDDWDSFAQATGTASYFV